MLSQEAIQSAAERLIAVAHSHRIESKRAPHETIGFRAQQACEKFLKAVLVLHDIVFERTHDLIVLFGLLEDIDF